MSLEKLLEEYRESSLKAINSLYREEYDELIKFIDEREKIIDKIKTIDYDKNLFCDIVKKIKINNIEQELSKCINSKKNQIKRKMEILNKGKDVGISYNVYQKKAVFFSKKV